MIYFYKLMYIHKNIIITYPYKCMIIMNIMYIFNCFIYLLQVYMYRKK